MDENSDSTDSKTVCDVSYSSVQESEEMASEHYVSIVVSPPPGFDNCENGEASQNKPDDRSEAALDSPHGTRSPGPVSPHLTPEARPRTGSALKLARSREQRIIRSSIRFSPGYIKAWRPEGNQPLKMKLSRALLSYPGAPENDPVVLDYDGDVARLAFAVAVVSPELNVDLEAWAAKWSGRSKKIMFSPRFTLQALQVPDPNGSTASQPDTMTCDVAMLQIAACKEKRINVIFIPVWEGVALKSMCSKVFPSWNIGDFTQWTIVTSEYSEHCDSYGSRVATLMSIKRCEDRFNATLFGVIVCTCVLNFPCIDNFTACKRMVAFLTEIC